MIGRPTVNTPLASNVDGQPTPFSMPVIELGVSQNVSYNVSGGASIQSLAFGATTVMIMLVTQADAVRVAIGVNPTAGAASTLLPASGVFFFHVNPGDKLAVLSNDSSAGSVNITEAVSF